MSAAMDENFPSEINTELRVWPSAPTQQSAMTIHAGLDDNSAPLTPAMFRF
jgi:hypothetical protein